MRYLEAALKIKNDYENDVINIHQYTILRDGLKNTASMGNLTQSERLEQYGNIANNLDIELALSTND